ncbi:MAG TPA: acyl-CoA dehydrogenase family protein [Thermoanaerobaculia bacterium]|nr:acyl-CoA dehydrogenase family protein [Thermoanaerobaculia bacterium]
MSLRDDVFAFVRDVVIPAESQPLTEELIATLREKARAAGIYGPQLPREYGGLGLNFLELCDLFEVAGRSFLGPLALHCAAPDEGNMHLLSLFANDEQRQRWLRPLAEGRIRSCFAMTEPAPGAGSDPSMLQTRATRIDAGWQIDGRKWFATGAEGAAFAIVMALTDEKRATMFLVPTDTPGYRFVRAILTMGGHGVGGHCELAFESMLVPDSAVIGEVGAGFRMAQVRLTPARLTHCMRWLGIAQRSLEIAATRARERDAFGKKLAEHQSIQWMLADSEIDLHASRVMVMDAARRHEAGSEIRHESSICKVFVAEAVNRVIDRAIQVCGSLGISSDLPLELFYREARAFRIYDGPSEVHRMVIARDVLRSES